MEKINSLRFLNLDVKSTMSKEDCDKLTKEYLKCLSSIDYQKDKCKIILEKVKSCKSKK
jgi:hypothetical protein